MKTQKTLHQLLLIAALSSGMASTAFAGNTWTGGGATGNWNDVNNWGGTIPATGQTIQFAGTTNLNVNNNISGGYAASGVQFASGAGAFTITGNKITLKTGIADSAAGVNETLNLGQTSSFGTNVNQTVSAVSTGTLTLNGAWQTTTAMTTMSMNGGGTINLNWNSGIAAVNLTISGAGTTVNVSNANALGGGLSTNSFNNVNVGSGSVLQLSNNISLGSNGGQIMSLTGTGVGSNGALENVSSNNSYAGAVTIGSGGASIGSDAGSLTLTGGITNNGNLLTVTGAGATNISTAPITGTGGLTKTNSGTLTLSGSNGYNGVTTVSGGSAIITNTAGSATGTGSVTVGANATFGGTGISSGTGYSIAGTGTATGSRANVLVGMTTGADTNTSSLLTMTASGASTIQNANLTFNIKAGTAGGLGGTSNGGSAGGLGVSGSGTEMSVGSTAITFGSGVASVTLTLNVQNEPGIIGLNTAYVLIAGTVASGGGGANGSQYSGLTLGTTTTLSTGETETVITGNNLQVAFGTALDQSYYANSYLVLYQNTNTGTDDIDVIVVPEPGTWAMMLGGLAVLVFWQRRKSKA